VRQIRAMTELTRPAASSSWPIASTSRVSYAGGPPLAQPVSDAKVDQPDGRSPLPKWHSGRASRHTRRPRRVGSPTRKARAVKVFPRPTRRKSRRNLIARIRAHQRIYHEILWAGESVGRSGLHGQALAPPSNALWDHEGARAAALAKISGSHRDRFDPVSNTSGGSCEAPIDEVLSKKTKTSMRARCARIAA